MTDFLCWSQFSTEEMVKHRLNMQAMIPRDQMRVLLGKISSSINMSEMTCSTKKVVRQFDSSNGLFECRHTFKFLHGIRQDQLTSLIKWNKADGLVPKEKNVDGRKNNT